MTEARPLLRGWWRLVDMRIGIIPLPLFPLILALMAAFVWLGKLLPEPGAIYVMDRGYVDFARPHVLHQAGAFFVTRAKSNLDAIGSTQPRLTAPPA
jgi:hypothetical protein